MAAVEDGRPERADGRRRRRRTRCARVRARLARPAPAGRRGRLVIGLGGFAIVNSQLAKDQEAPLKIVWTKEARDGTHDYEKWNAFSRVVVDGDGKPAVPFGWGMSSTLPAGQEIPQYSIIIDSNAGTVLTHYTGDPKETRLPPLRRHQPAALPAPERRRPGGRCRRRTRHPLRAPVRPEVGHRRRDQQDDARHHEQGVRRLHRSPRPRPAGALRQRRGPQLPRA